MKGECPNPRPECKYSDLGGCFSDTHHLFYPRRDYRTPTEKQFRELEENKEQLCRMEHDERHASEQPPVKPPRDTMVGRIALAS